MWQRHSCLCFRLLHYGSIRSATEVLIRNKWESLRWEPGPLGYPISDEFQDGAFRRSNFQRGFIRWSAETGAVASRSGHNID